MEKNNIKVFISSSEPDFKRFEMIEHFIEYASEKSDIIFLLEILKSDRSSIVRHEAAAQLLKIEQKKSWLLEDLREVIIEALLTVVMTDKSMVAKHESVEALSYIGDEKVLPILEKILCQENPENELLDSVRIAADAIRYKTKHKINSTQLSKFIMAGVR